MTGIATAPGLDDMGNCWFNLLSRAADDKAFPGPTCVSLVLEIAAGGRISEELAIVARAGLAVSPGPSIVAGVVLSSLTGICSTTYFDDVLSTARANGTGFFLRRIPLSDELDDAKDRLRSLAKGRVLGVPGSVIFVWDSVLDDIDRSSRSAGISPRRNLSSTARPVTWRLRFVPSTPSRLLPLLPLRLRFARSLPSITFAGGGGCSIHRVAPLLVGWVLTTGGCKSFTGGFRAT